MISDNVAREERKLKNAMNFMSGKAVYKAIFVVIGLFLFSSCSTSNSVTNTTAQTSSGNAAPSAAALLKHSPAGTADLTWNPTTHALTVKVLLVGLTPSSKHPAHIHAGSCTKAGDVLYPLQDVVADKSGMGSSTSTISSVTGGIPSTGWYINVHNGPGLSPAVQFLPLSCGNVSNTQPETTRTQQVQVILGTSPSQSQAVSGNAHLSLSGNTLLVTLSLQDLQSKTAHAAFIHEGNCGDQGKIVYTLKPVVANATGTGSATTTIKDVPSIPAVGWYISVHLTTDMTTQTSNDLIACGDVLPTH